MIRVLLVIVYPVVFILLCDCGRHGRVLKLKKMVSFKNFRPLWSVSSGFRADPGADHTAFRRNCESMFDSCLSNDSILL